MATTSIMFIVGLVIAPTWSFEFGYKNAYGDDYGKRWIFFPDGDEKPHYVDLTTKNIHLKTSSSESVQFRLYTRENHEDHIPLDNDLESIDTDSFIKKADVKVITHGWRSSADKDVVVNIKNAYLEKHDVNVIAVDWSDVADSIFYPWVTLQVPNVGKVVGKFLTALSKKYSVSGEQIHLIGHSLGAHVVGVAGSTSKLNISRITGLDPARPLFEFPERDISERLDKSDAEFVDVIHTCAGVLGYLEPLGHVDFYPNRGTAPQPGCLGPQAIFETCSHGKSHRYFAESILNPVEFHAHHCKNKGSETKDCIPENTVMGDSVRKDLSGVFYLTTDFDGIASMGRNARNVK